MSSLLAADKEVAPCRELQGGRVYIRCGVRGRGATAVVQAAWTGRVRLKALGARARAERTENMPSMFVTLDVSKLSAWSNANAFCRVETRACDARQGAGWKV